MLCSAIYCISTEYLLPTIYRSTIYFTPDTKDHGKIMACRAENPDIPDSGIDDTWTITVYCESNIFNVSN